jgi:hypothetical protein
MGSEHNAEVDLDVMKAIFNTAATAVASLYLATGSVTVAMTGTAVSAAITSWVVWEGSLARPRSVPPGKTVRATAATLVLSSAETVIESMSQSCRRIWEGTRLRAPRRGISPRPMGP